MPGDEAYQRVVLLVEDNALLRDLLATTLEVAGFRVATAENAAEAQRLLKLVDPDAMVVDIELGAGPTGFDLADAVMNTSPDIGLVFLTNVPDPRFLGRGEKGVSKKHAYLSKAQLASGDDLVQALDAVLHQRVTDEHRHNLSLEGPLNRLSKHQIEVVQMMAAGQSNQQIATTRGISVRAVERMISRIFEAFKLEPTGGKNARVEAVALYVRSSQLGKSD